MDPYIGQLLLVGFNFAPRGWALCNGQLMSINENTALFSLLGTTYGGDGRTTFALPDLRGRTPIGVGQGPGLDDIRLGERGGAEQAQLTVNSMPSHTHDVTTRGSFTLGASRGNGTAGDGQYLSSDTGSAAIFNAIASDSATLKGMEGITVAAGNAGGGQPFPIRDPFLGMNWIIALVGTFPSRP